MQCASKRHQAKDEYVSNEHRMCVEWAIHGERRSEATP